jgi:putative Ca2+/H+ antiporter (TMEM165/GDT1 family)
MPALLTLSLSFLGDRTQIVAILIAVLGKVSIVGIFVPAVSPTNSLIWKFFQYQISSSFISSLIGEILSFPWRATQHYVLGGWNVVDTINELELYFVLPVSSANRDTLSFPGIQGSICI